MAERDWSDAGQGWQGKETNLRLIGWSRQRRVVLLRRPFNRPLALLDRSDPGQPQLGFVEVLGGKREVWEYAALVTSLVVVGDLVGAGAAQERGVVGETPNRFPTDPARAAHP